MLHTYKMKRIVKYPALLILSITFLYAACDDGITPPPYDGPWERVKVPEDIGYNSIWFTSPNDGWVAGMGGIGHYNGNQWEVVKKFGDNDTERYFFGDIIARSPSDVWTCGRYEPSGTVDDGFIVHYDGVDWEIEVFPNFEWLSALWFFDDGTGWAGGGYGLMRYDGTDWELYQGSYSVGKFYFHSPDDGWMITSTRIYYWDGVEWTEAFDPWDAWIYDIDFAAPDDGWVVGDRWNYHYDGTEWKRYEPLDNKTFEAVHFLNDHFGWGGYGYAYFYDGETWTEVDDGEGPSGYGYYDFFCVSENDVWGCGPSEEGYFMHFTGFD
jgi:hypothetical protein